MRDRRDLCHASSIDLSGVFTRMAKKGYSNKWTALVSNQSSAWAVALRANDPSGIINSMQPVQPAILLDRDGVIIENIPTYIRTWDDVCFIPGAIEALARLNPTPFKIVVITNQSAVGRGLLSIQSAWAINDRVLQIIEQAGGRIDGTFLCPHTPQDNCDCRKPKPGLVLQAARQLSLELKSSYLIGDALSDMLAGQAAGVGQTIMVRTGRGAQQEKLPPPPELKPFRVYDNLALALAELIKI